MTHRSHQVVLAARQLRDAGLSEVDLSRLHHFSRSGRGITFRQVHSYFTSRKELRDENAAFAERICFVASEHSLHPEKDLIVLVDSALAKWPL